MPLVDHLLRDKLKPSTAVNTAMAAIEPVDTKRKRRIQAKERKKIIKGMKYKVGKIAHDKCGTLVPVFIFSIVDDTKLLSKVIIRELEGASFRSGLLLNLRIPTTSLVLPRRPGGNSTGPSTTITRISSCLRGIEPTLSHARAPYSAQALPLDYAPEDTQNLILASIQNNLSPVAMGGADSILRPTLDGKLETLHGVIASLAAHPKMEGSDEQHLFEHFHSSRTIRKLILDSPSFACTLYEKALKGKCSIWAQGHRSVG
ncbi:hypothetical protein RND71_001941 [Anisodus tanguticus]|uniref:Uncharacterized protein n=1 Tax=Anisodus tanguticus TaxID=243964 RepID=A0AAE1VYD6_9SOLA|nr:hypothetical protein RND71_001941 [Anisodus tanguticus]